MLSWTSKAEGVISAQANVSNANVKARCAGRSQNDFTCAAKVDMPFDI